MITHTSPSINPNENLIAPLCLSFSKVLEEDIGGSLTALIHHLLLCVSQTFHFRRNNIVRISRRQLLQKFFGFKKLQDLLEILKPLFQKFFIEYFTPSSQDSQIFKTAQVLVQKEIKIRT